VFTAQMPMFMGRLDLRPRDQDHQVAHANSRPYGPTSTPRAFQSSCCSAPIRSRPSTRARWQLRNTAAESGFASTRWRSQRRHRLYADYSRGFLGPARPVTGRSRNGSRRADRQSQPYGIASQRVRSTTTKPTPSRTRSSLRPGNGKIQTWPFQARRHRTDMDVTRDGHV